MDCTDTARRCPDIFGMMGGLYRTSPLRRYKHHKLASAGPGRRLDLWSAQSTEVEKPREGLASWLGLSFPTQVCGTAVDSAETEFWFPYQGDLREVREWE
jgi:hypothetical protein